MSLTGSGFLFLVAALTVAAFVTLVVVWPALAGHGPGRVAARVGMLLLVNVLVLLTAATQLNAAFLFFADWTDLRGALGGAPTVTAVARGGTASRAASRTVAGAAARAATRLPPLPAGVGSAGVISYTVRGAASGLTGAVVVQLPPTYRDPRRAAQRYPVIETFHGYAGYPSLWITLMNLGGVMAQQVAAGKMQSALIVSPQIEFPGGVDTECVNGRPGNPQIETWLTQDVPNWVTHTFRVRTVRSSWATIGLSAGGWCAAMATMLHPAQYSAAIVLGGYFRPEFGPFYEPYPPNSPLTRRYDLVALARRRPPPIAMWLETSHADAVSYRSSAAFLKVTRPPLSVDAVVLQHAGHRLALWQAILPRSLAWLGANVPGFAARP
jgi:Putative esterase